jgi:hypothetical protein
VLFKVTRDVRSQVASDLCLESIDEVHAEHAAKQLAIKFIWSEVGSRLTRRRSILKMSSTM